MTFLSIQAVFSAITNSFNMTYTSFGSQNASESIDK